MLHLPCFPGADSDGDESRTKTTFPRRSNEWSDYDEDGLGDNVIQTTIMMVLPIVWICAPPNGLLEASGNEDTLLDIARFEFCAVLVDGVPTMQFTIELSSNFTGDSLQLLFWLE